MRTVDLSSHINRTIERGTDADFPVALRPLLTQRDDGALSVVSHRLAVVRTDTEEPISVVSDRYTLVPHVRILDCIREAIMPLDVGPVPSGVYVDRNGARMRALFKFPALSQRVSAGDEICPCIKVSNTYDGSSQISLHIGAFRFVCTNLAVGGGGCFAEGFMSIHVGDIDIEAVADRLSKYLIAFESIVELYRAWMQIHGNPDQYQEILQPCGKVHAERLIGRIVKERSVYEAYNACTAYATHEMRSFRLAFECLDQINAGFQKCFPVNGTNCKSLINEAQEEPQSLLRT